MPLHVLATADDFLRGLPRLQPKGETVMQLDAYWYIPISRGSADDKPGGMVSSPSCKLLPGMWTSGLHRLASCLHPSFV